MQKMEFTSTASNTEGGLGFLFVFPLMELLLKTRMFEGVRFDK